MIVDLTRILQEPRRFQLTLHSDWWRADEKAAQIQGLDAPVEARIAISRAGEHYILEGSIRGGLQLRCDRCLDCFTLPMDARFRIALSCTAQDDAEEEVELLEEDMGVGFIEGEEVDLAEVVREQIYLYAPIKCLCREDCAGLCPGCGANLNQGPCGCVPRQMHPGFSVLRNLKLVKE